MLYEIIRAFIILNEFLTITWLGVRMRVHVLHVLGILNKTDKQLALLCFIMFIIKREICLFYRTQLLSLF